MKKNAYLQKKGSQAKKKLLLEASPAQLEAAATQASKPLGFGRSLLSTGGGGRWFAHTK